MENLRIPTHPGEIIKEELECRCMTQKRLAEIINVPYTQLNETLNGKRPLSVDLALLIEAAMGINSELLINMQNRRNIAVAKQRPTFVSMLDSIRQKVAVL